jgi:hypothetical protein
MRCAGGAAGRRAGARRTVRRAAGRAVRVAAGGEAIAGAVIRGAAAVRATGAAAAVRCAAIGRWWRTARDGRARVGGTGAVPPEEDALRPPAVVRAFPATELAGVAGVGGVGGVGGACRTGVGGVGGVGGVAGVGGVCTTGVGGVAGVGGVSGAAMPPVAVFVCVTGPVTAPGLSITTWTFTFTGPVWAAAPVPAVALPASPGVMTTCTETGCGALRSARAAGAGAQTAVAPISTHPRRPIIARYMPPAHARDPYMGMYRGGIATYGDFLLA